MVVFVVRVCYVILGCECWMVGHAVFAGDGDDNDDDIIITSDEERDLINEIQEEDMDNLNDETKWKLELYQLVSSQCLWPIIQQQQQPFNGRLSGTTREGRYQKKHSPAHTYPGQRISFITFLHLQWSTASSLFSLHAWQSSRTTSFQVLFGLPLGLEPSTLYSMHFFTQSSSSFRSTCPYQCRLVLPFWHRLTQVVPEKGPLNVWTVEFSVYF